MNRRYSPPHSMPIKWRTQRLDGNSVGIIAEYGIHGATFVVPKNASKALICLAIDTATVELLTLCGNSHDAKPVGLMAGESC